MKLVLFDLDNTLLSGDSDSLWCEFLIAQGELDGNTFAARNADIEVRYKNGTVGPEEFSNFYVGTLAGRTPESWEALRQKFLAEAICPRIGRAAMELTNQHLDAGDLVILTTATNRFLTELTATYLGIDHLIATEPQVSNGLFTGRCVGQLNMREGKVIRLHDWLARGGHQLQNLESVAYSDSINDLPLLQAVNRAVAVDPDPKLRAEALERRWDIVHLER